MGNCENYCKKEQLQFKRTQIFKPKNINHSHQINKENIPPPQLDTYSITIPNDEFENDRNIEEKKKDNQQSNLTYHLSNSLVEVKMSALNQKQPTTKQNLPTLIYKDTDHQSSDKKSNNQRKSISVDEILNGLEQCDLLNSNHRKQLKFQGPIQLSQSEKKKQQLRMKYTQSYYINENQNYIHKA